MPDDKDLNFDALRAVAKAATPGPWHHTRELSDDTQVAVCEVHPIRLHSFNDSVGTLDEEANQANCKFIAIFNPALVLRLLDLAEKGAKK